MLALLFLCGLAAGAPGDAEAQGAGRPLSAEGVQGLAFGDLMATLPETVQWQDQLRAARIDIQGRNRAEVLIEFLFPADLTGPGGAGIPLSVGPGQAAWGHDAGRSDGQPLDPQQPTVIELHSNGRAHVFVGGTVMPGSVPLGAYSAGMSITLSYIDN